MRAFFGLVMRAVGGLGGISLLILGCIWMLQGFNIAFLDSFMTYDRLWALWGAILAAVGSAMLYWTATRAQ